MARESVGEARQRVMEHYPKAWVLAGTIGYCIIGYSSRTSGGVSVSEWCDTEAGAWLSAARRLKTEGGK